MSKWRYLMIPINGSVRPKVVIVGCGFGGLNAARTLKNAAIDVTVIDRTNHSTFQPLLYQVALGVLAPSDMAQPIRSILRKAENIQVLMGEVTDFNTDRRSLKLNDGGEISYDYLIVAAGATHSYFGKSEWARIAPGLKTLEDAVEIRRRILTAFESAEGKAIEHGSDQHLNFVIVGGGPSGVELAGAISDIAKLYMTRDFRRIRPAEASVIILEGSSHVLGTYSDDLQKRAVEQLQALKVEVRTNAKVTDVQPGFVMVGEERIPSACTLWAAGVAASPLGKILAAKTGAALDHKGCVVVNHFLNPMNHPEIFVVGDLSHVEENGKTLPGMAQPAMQMGAYAAKRIQLLAKSADAASKQKGFLYFDKGDLAVIGRKAAIARIAWPFKAHWSGLMAWITWLTVHLFFLIGFRNRTAVLIRWAYTYLTFHDGVRLIVGTQPPPAAITDIVQDQELSGHLTKILRQASG